MNEPVALGLDVGGTKIAAVLLDGADRVRARRERPTEREEGASLRQARALVVDMREEAARHGLQIAQVGVGVPELVGIDGSIRSAWNFEWRGVDLADALGVAEPLAVESDVRAAALAELRLGHGRDLPSFAYVNIGTGLSYAFCTGGRLHRGARGFAIHFASSDLMPVCGACGRQTPFNLEGFASGGGLRATYTLRTGHDLGGARPIVEGAMGDAGALLLKQALTALAAGLGQMVDMLDPHGLVLGGGLAAAFAAPIRERIGPHVWAEEARGVAVLTSGLGDDGGAVGAALAGREAAP